MVPDEKSPSNDPGREAPGCFIITSANAATTSDCAVSGRAAIFSSALKVTRSLPYSNYRSLGIMFSGSSAELYPVKIAVWNTQ
jgi:hypothetical protein